MPEKEFYDEKNMTNADLAQLSVTDCTLTPAFSPDITEYTCTVPDDAFTALINFKQQDEKAGVIINNKILTHENYRKIDLDSLDFDNHLDIRITVRAQYKSITKDYKIRFFRSPAVPRIAIKYQSATILPDDTVEIPNVIINKQQKIEIMISNPGTARLTFTGTDTYFDLSADSTFSQTNDLTQHLDAGESRSVILTFQTNTPGSYKAHATIQSNAETHNQFTFSINITCKEQTTGIIEDFEPGYFNTNAWEITGNETPFITNTTAYSGDHSLYITSHKANGIARTALTVKALENSTISFKYKAHYSSNSIDIAILLNNEEYKELRSSLWSTVTVNLAKDTVTRLEWLLHNKTDYTFGGLYLDEITCSSGNIKLLSPVIIEDFESNTASLDAWMLKGSNPPTIVNRPGTLNNKALAVKKGPAPNQSNSIFSTIIKPEQNCLLTFNYSITPYETHNFNSYKFSITNKNITHHLNRDNTNWKPFCVLLNADTIYCLDWENWGDDDSTATLFIDDLKIYGSNYEISAPLVLDDFETGDFSRLPWRLSHDPAPEIITQNAASGDYSVSTNKNTRNATILYLYIKANTDSFLSFIHNEEDAYNNYFQFYINNLYLSNFDRYLYGMNAIRNFSLTGNNEYIIEWRYSNNSDTVKNVHKFDDLILYYGDVEFSTITEPETIDNFETGDFSKNDWIFTGDVAPVITNTNKSEGTYSAQFKINDAERTCSMETTINLTKKSMIQFNYKAEDTFINESFNFYINNNYQTDVSSNSDNRWKKSNTVIIDAGTHTLKWEFTSNAYYTITPHEAYIDNIRFIVGGE